MSSVSSVFCVVFFQAEDGIRDLVRSRGLGDVYKRQLLGAYFASMGLFAFGCAAGNCFGANQNTEMQQIENIDAHDIEFEEVKRK